MTSTIRTKMNAVRNSTAAIRSPLAAGRAEAALGAGERAGRTETLDAGITRKFCGKPDFRSEKLPNIVIVLAPPRHPWLRAARSRPRCERAGVELEIYI